MGDALAISVLPVCLLALALLGFGERIVGQLGSVRKLREMRKSCETWTVRRHVAGVPVADVCEMRFVEVGNPPAGNAPEAALKHIRFGDIAVIVHHKERTLRHSIREVRFYAGAFLLFIVIASLLVAPNTAGGLELVRKLSADHLVPVLEIIMCVLWMIRLGGEVVSIDGLFRE